MQVPLPIYYYKQHYIARIESYIDIEGTIKKAVSYGKDAGAMKIWFDFEEEEKSFWHMGLSRSSIFLQ